MKTVNLQDLSAEDLYALIDEGERFYVRTDKSNILPEPDPNYRRDSFWFKEAPAAKQPLREIVTEHCEREEAPKD